MKKTLIVLAIFLLPVTALAQSTGGGINNPLWKLLGGSLQPVLPSFPVQVGNLTVTGTCTGCASGAVTGTQGQDVFMSANNVEGATSTIFINTAGNVGIATTTPSNALDIASSNATQLTLENDMQNSGSVTGINFVTPRTGVLNTGSITDSWFGDGSGRIGMMFTSPRDTIGGGFSFISNGGTPRLFIDTSNGHTGVGTTTPLQVLSVIDPTGGSSIPLHIENALNSGGQYVGLSMGRSIEPTMSEILTYAELNGTRALHFFVERSGALIDAMDVVSNGTVGIASTTPSSTLSIAMASTTSSLTIGVAGSSTPSLFVDSANNNGYVGIRTSLPIAPLEVIDTGVQSASSGIELARAGVPTQFIGISEDATVAHWIAGAGSKPFFFTNQDTSAASGFEFDVNNSTTPGGGTRAFNIMTSGNVGLSSTSPTYTFSIGSTTSITTNTFSVDSAGNQYGGGGKPSVSCASTCAVDANAHDSSGTIFLSGVQTSVTLTFYSAKPYAPHCISSDNVTAGNYDASSTLTSVVFSTAVSLGTASISYSCPL